MLNKIKQQISKNKQVIAAVRGARALWRMLAVLVPAFAAAYLLVKFNDIIVIGLAVLLALYALSQLIRGMWMAELNRAK